MQQGLSGRKIAMLTADGVAAREVQEITRALESAGAAVPLVSTHDGDIRTEGAGSEGAQHVSCTTAEAKAADYDGLVIAGGATVVDVLRRDAAAVSFTRDFMESDKPVGTICHGALLLVEADAVRGRTVTASPSIQTDVRNAGGEWLDKAVQVDQKLVTGRGPEDLVVFCAQIVKVFDSAIEERTTDQLSEMSFPASDPPPGPGSIGGTTRREEAQPSAP